MPTRRLADVTKADVTERIHSRPGEQNGRHKLTAEQVREIIRDPRGYRATARAYGVDRRTIARIRLGALWASVTNL